MLKTENYQLNKPEVTDPLRVADFNENADIMDAALGAMPNIVTGTYTGNGAENRTISLEFTPKAVFVYSSKGGTCYNGPTGALLIWGGLVLPGKSVQYVEQIPAALAIVDGGFQVSYYDATSVYNCTNSSDNTYYYMALC